MSDEKYFVRLKTYSPRQGFTLQRYHFNQHLFQGGERPTWYLVDTNFATRCRLDTQPSGAPSFDVVTEAEKVDIDRVEEQRRLVELGLLSATAPLPAQRVTQDLTKLNAPTPQRSAALPPDNSQIGGDLGTKDLGIALGAK